MIVKLLTEHHFEFLSLKGGCKGSSSLYMSKCHNVGNLMHWLNCIIFPLANGVDPEQTAVTNTA